MLKDCSWGALTGKDAIASTLWHLSTVRDALQMAAYQAKIKFIFFVLQLGKPHSLRCRLSRVGVGACFSHHSISVELRGQRPGASSLFFHLVEERVSLVPVTVLFPGDSVSLPKSARVTHVP